MDQFTISREPGDVAFVSSRGSKCVRLPTYRGKTGEFLSITMGYTLEISTKSLLDMIDQARFFLLRVSPILLLRAFTYISKDQALSLLGKASELDVLLADLCDRLDSSFSISRRSEHGRNAFDHLLDRHVRNDKRYQALAVTNKRNVLRITERFRGTTYRKLREELRDSKTSSTLLGNIRNAVLHRPVAKLPLDELLESSKRTADDIDAANDAWRKAVDGIKHDLMKTAGLQEASKLYSKIKALYDKAQDLDSDEFVKRLHHLNYSMCDVFTTVDGPTKIIAFLEDWIETHRG